jgi:DNA-binding transcriptional ArsR family regulator
MAGSSRKPDSPVQLFHLTPSGQKPGPVQSHDCVMALRALGEDTRVRIVGLLMEDALDVGEIARRLGVSPYYVSTHGRILRDAGLLDVQKNGRTRLYALAESIRGRADATGVLDLGCCSFQFEGTVKEKPRRLRSRPKRLEAARVSSARVDQTER